MAGACGAILALPASQSGARYVVSRVCHQITRSPADQALTAEKKAFQLINQKQAIFLLLFRVLVELLLRFLFVVIGDVAAAAAETATAAATAVAAQQPLAGTAAVAVVGVVA